jgi:hypothetical protein
MHRRCRPWSEHLLAVQRDVETLALLLARDAQADGEVGELQQPQPQLQL